MDLPFHSYRLRSRKAAQTRLFNCYAQQAPPEGRSPQIIQGMAGIRPFTSLSGVQRAAIEFNGALYCVLGSSLISVTSSGAVVSIGNIAGEGRIDIAKNSSQIAILVEPNLFVYDGATLSQVSDSGFTSRGAKRMAVMDNYGGFVEPKSGRWFICDLANFTVYDPLDFATAEGNPDGLLSIESNNQQFILFGSESIEMWDNTGRSGFPFERNPNGYVESGCGAPYATCSADNTVYWIDQHRLARRLEGNVARRFSTDGVEEKWQDYSTITDATAIPYVFDGHTFVVFTFPTAGAVWVYDINTQEWHERGSIGYNHWRVAWIVEAYDKTLVGDTESGNIGTLSATTYTEWGRHLVREGTSGAIVDHGRWIYHDRLELDLDVGGAPLTGQGSAPSIMLDVSDDGGVTFRSKPSRSLGATGQYAKRIHWDGMGRSRERVYRFRVSDPVPFIVTGATLDTR
jgi:stabilization protein